VLWSLSRAAASLPVFSAGSHYAINVLAADQKELAERFAAKGGDRWTGVTSTPARRRAAAARRRGHLRMLQPQPLRGRRPRHLHRRGGALHASRTGAMPLLFHGGRFYTELPL
jgi:hypothetical protein